MNKICIDKGESVYGFEEVEDEIPFFEKVYLTVVDDEIICIPKNVVKVMSFSTNKKCRWNFFIGYKGKVLILEGCKNFWEYKCSSYLKFKRRNKNYIGFVNVENKLYPLISLDSFVT